MNIFPPLLIRIQKICLVPSQYQIEIIFNLDLYYFVYYKVCAPLRTFTIAMFLRPPRKSVDYTSRSLRSSTPIKVQHVMHDNSNISLSNFPLLPKKKKAILYLYQLLDLEPELKKRVITYWQINNKPHFKKENK